MTMIEDARKLRIPVTGATIEAYGVAAKSKLVAAASTTAAEKGRLEAFNVSGKWVRNLVLRNELVSKVLHGEAGSVDADATAEGLRKVREACQEYELANIFNVDETGIFYKLLPNRTYLSQAENRKTARGTKGMKAKDSVSAYMCTNATGTANVPMSIIGKSKNPRCFRVTPCPIKYWSQANAWPDGPTFKKWWLEVFLPFIRRWTHLPVLLLMGGCSSHDSLVDSRKLVKTIVYPPNCTSKHQPMDMGIIAATKRHYQRRLLGVRASTMYVRETLRAQAKERKMVSGTMGLAEGHETHALDAAELLRDAWSDVTRDTIAR